ncbi:MAG: YkgJ family cysteine cluster protein [Planctomycetes bacterium]|nr:YkgJ family cysteine cluster protein [Planctomycetota bacterium]
MQKETESTQPWYGSGLAFECTGCGGCCAGPAEGYVWVSDEEITAMAAFLGVTPEQFRRQYTRRVSRRITLVERRDNHDCIFLGPPDSSGRRGCTVYQVRPSQCRTWPFWPSNLADPDSWSAAAHRCRGVNRGRLFTLKEIEERARLTP